MGDMPNDFWAGWIAILTITSFVGLGWLIYSIYFSRDIEHEEAEGPVWDENLREGSSPAPMWWFWLILALMVLSVLYLMLYPGLGSYAGALRWSQGGHLDASVSDYQSEFGGTRNLIAEAQLATLRADPELVKSAQRIFDRNCAVCHGYDAAGQAATFPDLTDTDWQWGGTAAQIEQSIRGGRNAVMIGWSTMLGENGVLQMADYVTNISKHSAAGHPAQTPYNQFCAACHGLDGSGNAAIGAPSLIDDAWLYGADTAALRETIANGRSGEMPAFGQRLDETQIRLLVMLLTPASGAAQ